MIAFVTSLRNPLNSDSYERVELLLRDTLASVCGQTDRDFVVVVVGNRAPDFALPDKVHFVEVDFPPPTSTSGPRTALKPFVWDKGTKIGIGLAFARQFDPAYVMIFDADDFVSNQIAGFVNARRDRPGWYVRDGWMYSGSRKVFKKQPNFNKTCGTCFVLPFEAYAVPPDLSVGASQAEVAEAFGERLYRILGAHRDAFEWHADRGRHLEPLPFRGAVYHVDTGENHSGKTMDSFARPSTPALRREFNVPDDSGLLPALWRSVDVGGPRAILRRVVRKLRRGLRKVMGT